MYKRIFTILAVAILAFNACDSSEMVQENGTDVFDIALKGSELTAVQDLVNSLQKSIEEYASTNKMLTEYIDELKAKIESIESKDTQIRNSAEELNKEKSVFEKQIEGLASVINNAGNDIKKWVETSYVTKEAFTALQNTVSSINTSITTINSRLSGIDDTTAKIAKDLENATKSINADLGKVQTEIGGFISDIEKLEGRMDNLEKEIAALIGSIQSIVVVPDYTDGSVSVSGDSQSRIYFEIYPLSAAERLASAGKSCVSLDAVETLTKAETKIGIPVSSVGFDGSYFYVEADGTGLDADIRNGKKSANASLRISDGKVTRSSRYFQLTYKVNKGGFIKVTASNISTESVDFSGSTDILKTDDNNPLYYGISLTYSKNEDSFVKLGQGNYIASRDTLNLRISENGTLSAPPAYTLNLGCTYRFRPYVYSNGIFRYGNESSFNTPTLFDTPAASVSSEYGMQKIEIDAQLLLDGTNFVNASGADVYVSTKPDVDRDNHEKTLFGSVDASNHIHITNYFYEENTTFYFMINTTLYNTATGYSKHCYSEVGSFTTGENE